jgi:membrane protease YdiL (CAAX protease family)
MERIRRPSILEVNILFLVLGILLFVVGGIVQTREVYTGLLITEYIIILLPNLLYLKFKGYSLKKVLRLNRINLKQILYVFGITIFSYPVAVFLNGIVIAIVSFFSEQMPNAVPIPDSSAMYFFSLFVIAIAPGICEEVMFRGTIMNAYENLGKRKAIIYSSILFGIFHLNLQNLVGPIFLGLVLGMTAYKTNSIYASMLGHTLNNGIAITIGYFANKAQSITQEVPALEISYQLQLIIGIALIGIFALVSMFILMGLLKNIPEGQDVLLEEVEYKEIRPIYYLPILGIIILFLFVNIMYLFL